MATVADDALAAQAVNRMLSAGADVAQAFQQDILRSNSGNAALALSASRVHETTTQLLTYNGAMALLGNNMELQAGVLAANSVKGEPRPAPYWGTGMPGAGGSPSVYMVSPTGQVTKA